MGKVAAEGLLSLCCLWCLTCGGVRWRSGEAAPAVILVCLERGNRGGGKVENLVLVFHFSIRLHRRHCGNVGIPPAVGGIPKGLVERGGSLLLAFHAFHSPAISTVLAFHGLRHRANNSSLTFCIRRAASVSLIADARPCSMHAVVPVFKDSSQLGNDLSFS